MEGNQQPKTALRALHQCRRCGHFMAREQMQEIERISGVIECSKCGEAGPLNVIIELEDTQRSDPERSSR